MILNRKKRLAFWLLSGCLIFITFSIGFCAQADWAESRFIYPEYSKKISMDFKDAALPDVLKILSQQSGMNFITAQEVVNKRVTLFLENVPVEEALEKILKANDLTYDMQEGSGLFIVKALKDKIKVATRVYPLKYATVPSSKLSRTISISNTSSTAGADGTNNGILAAVKAVLSSSGVLVEDPRTNSLIITDEEIRFPLIEQTIAQLDVSIPEILIEVEMLDVSKDATDLMGIKFGSTPLEITGSKGNTLFPLARDINQVALVGKGYLTQPKYTVGTIDASGFKAQLDFLKTRSDTKNLARPRLLTLNNETAQIKISTNEAIGLLQVSSSISGSSSGAESSVQAERVATGVFLTVTPQANILTREITMAVAPKVIQARLSSGDFEGHKFKDPEERGSQSILRVKDGETIVIGGLLRTDDANTITKVPFLGDIPLLGAAFRHKDKNKNRRELIIFLTPHILDEKNKAALVVKKDAPIEGFKGEDSFRVDEIDKDLSTVEHQRF